MHSTRIRKISVMILWRSGPVRLAGNLSVFAFCLLVENIANRTCTGFPGPG